MFRHVVMFAWADGVGDADVAEVAVGLDGLVHKIVEIREYRHGVDAGISDGNYDYVVVADFDSIDGYKVYRDHPAHLAFIENVVAGRVARRAAVQYETGV